MISAGKFRVGIVPYYQASSTRVLIVAQAIAPSLLGRLDWLLVARLSHLMYATKTLRSKTTHQD